MIKAGGAAPHVELCSTPPGDICGKKKQMWRDYEF